MEKARHQIKKLEAELKQRINESALQAKSLIALTQERDVLAAQAAEAQQVGPAATAAATRGTLQERGAPGGAGGRKQAAEALQHATVVYH